MANPTLDVPDAAISCHEALQVAQHDAEQVYRDLSPYRISISLEPEGWQVDYDLKDEAMNGGGPHYVINAGTGEISWKRYDQ